MESLLALANPRSAHIPRARAAPPGVDDLVLGRYRLLECLGAGGFGVVWRARDELLHREVAVKRVSLGPDVDSERASREALASARLAHPAIVALYEACAIQDAFYLISELVHGRTLAQLIASRALSDEQVLEIGVALASALAHAHARGVIHRDIKPQNVLVPDQLEERAPTSEGFLGAAKLTDFGGASLAGEDVLTCTGDVLGTLAYMAPEQSEGREVGEQADLYSLALVLYEALTGANPVRGATPAATARRIGGSVPPSSGDARISRVRLPGRSTRRSLRRPRSGGRSISSAWPCRTGSSRGRHARGRGSGRGAPSSCSRVCRPRPPPPVGRSRARRPSRRLGLSRTCGVTRCCAGRPCRGSSGWCARWR